MKRFVVLVVFVGFLALSGCAAAAPRPGATPSSVQNPQLGPISVAQKAALSDNKVTYAEYEAGWRRYVACDARAGYTVQNQGETNEIINGSVPSAAVSSGVDAKCYNREFKQIDQVWQLSREETSPAATAYRLCLIDAGATPASTESEMYQQLQKLKIDPIQCLHGH